jgi:hypothetical protein
MKTGEYAYTTFRRDGKRVAILLHRFLLGLPPHRPLVDHIDFDGLNCRRSNMRIATRTQNNINKRTKGGGNTGYRGIERTIGGKWHARITVAKKRTNLGVYDDPADAARAYDAAAKRLFGEFAVLNFPEKEG